MSTDERDKLVLRLQERRCGLEAARISALENLNCIRGGIAEVDFLIEQLEAEAAAEAEAKPAEAKLPAKDLRKPGGEA
jgi:hypothetical protein